MATAIGGAAAVALAVPLQVRGVAGSVEDILLALGALTLPITAAVMSLALVPGARWLDGGAARSMTKARIGCYLLASSPLIWPLVIRSVPAMGDASLSLVGVAAGCFGSAALIGFLLGERWLALPSIVYVAACLLPGPVVPRAANLLTPTAHPLVVTVTFLVIWCIGLLVYGALGWQSNRGLRQRLGR